MRSWSASAAPTSRAADIAWRPSEGSVSAGEASHAVAGTIGNAADLTAARPPRSGAVQMDRWPNGRCDAQASGSKGEHLRWPLGVNRPLNEKLMEEPFGLIPRQSGCQLCSNHRWASALPVVDHPTDATHPNEKSALRARFVSQDYMSHDLPIEDDREAVPPWRYVRVWESVRERLVILVWECAEANRSAVRAG